MKNWFKRNAMEITLWTLLAVVVIATIVAIIVVLNGGTVNADFNVAQWTANPANPASPVGKILH